ncbi:hypothetical protein L8097_002779 [Salmonella enterica]|nr:hypothetical protein [Salmonella enterica]
MAEHTLATPEQKITDSLKYKIGELVLMELANYVTSEARLNAYKFSDAIPPELIGALESLSLGAIRDVSRQFAEKYITFRLDFTALVHDFAQERIRKNIIKELILRLASYSYIKEVTRCSIKEINDIEREINFSGSKTGKKIPVGEHDYIRRVYSEHYDFLKGVEFSQARSLIATSRKTGYPVFRIENIILK